MRVLGIDGGPIEWLGVMLVKTTYTETQIHTHNSPNAIFSVVLDVSNKGIITESWCRPWNVNDSGCDPACRAL